MCNIHCTPHVQHTLLTTCTIYITYHMYNRVELHKRVHIATTRKKDQRQRVVTKV